MSTPLHHAQHALGALVARWREPVSPSEVPEGRQAFVDPEVRAFFSAADQLPPSEVPDFMEQVARAIDSLPPFQAARLALMAGTQIEKGADPSVTLTAILGVLRRAEAPAREYLARAEATGRDDDALSPEVHPEGFVALSALRFACMAAMAGLVGSVALRHRARRDPALLEGLVALDQGTSMGELSALTELLLSSDDETVIVVCPATGRGARLRTVAVRRCAHLYTLLDLVLQAHAIALHRPAGAPVPDLGPSDRTLLAAARGDVEAWREIRSRSFHGALLFGPFIHIGPDRAFTPMPIPGVDAPLSAFPRLDEAIVLGAGDYQTHGPQRSWSADFFDPLHGSLRSDLVLEQELPAEQVERWMERITGR